MCKLIYQVDLVWFNYIYIYIYIYAFSRRFIQATYIAFKLQFYIDQLLLSLGIETHDLGVVSAMLYQLSYRKACSSTTGFQRELLNPLKLDIWRVTVIENMKAFIEPLDIIFKRKCFLLNILLNTSDFHGSYSMI